MAKDRKKVYRKRQRKKLKVSPNPLCELCFGEGLLYLCGQNRQIHDELDISLENSQQVDKVKEIMENCVEKLKVPSVVNERKGKTWGEAGK